MSQPRLAIDGLSKAFGGIQALDKVNFNVAPGSIHALLGENGAGKSTLVKIVTGMHEADAGIIALDGRRVRFHSPMEARADGVVAVHQDPKLFPHLDIAENIFMGAHPRDRLGLVARGAMYARAQSLLDGLEAGLSARRPVMGISIGEAQLVEFARAMAAGEMRLLFLDEPTAALTPTETERLFRFVRARRAAGASVVFISHRLEEIEGLVDSVTILRDGRQVLSVPAAGLTQDRIVRAMVGRDVAAARPREATEAVGRVRLAVEGLAAPGAFRDVCFQLRAGEVVGMAGLVGAGRSEIAQGIMGLTPVSAGSVSVDGRAIARPTPRRMIRAGVVYLAEDRDTVGLATSHSVSANLSLAALEQVSALGVLRPRAEAALAGDMVRRLRIKVGDVVDAVSTLSGGNRQKVAIGKWLARAPGVYLLDEPTHGIDVGTKAHIHGIIADLAAAGAAILVISSDLPEVLAISDRVLVVRNGRIAADISRVEASEESVLAHATGQGRAA